MVSIVFTLSSLLPPLDACFPLPFLSLWGVMYAVCILFRLSNTSSPPSLSRRQNEEPLSSRGKSLAILLACIIDRSRSSIARCRSLEGSFPSSLANKNGLLTGVGKASTFPDAFVLLHLARTSLASVQHWGHKPSTSHQHLCCGRMANDSSLLETLSAQATLCYV